MFTIWGGGVLEIGREDYLDLKSPFFHINPTHLPSSQRCQVTFAAKVAVAVLDEVCTKPCLGEVWRLSWQQLLPLSSEGCHS